MPQPFQFPTPEEAQYCQVAGQVAAGLRSGVRVFRTIPPQHAERFVIELQYGEDPAKCWRAGIKKEDDGTLTLVVQDPPGSGPEGVGPG